jgi:phage shock protein E
MNWLGRHKWEVFGLAMGAVAGWSYWYFIGCASGSCPITSQPLNSSLYGSALGWLAGGLIRGDKENSQKKNGNDEQN